MSLGSPENGTQPHQKLGSRGSRRHVDFQYRRIRGQRRPAHTIVHGGRIAGQHEPPETGILGRPCDPIQAGEKERDIPQIGKFEPGIPVAPFPIAIQFQNKQVGAFPRKVVDPSLRRCLLFVNRSAVQARIFGRFGQRSPIGTSHDPPAPTGLGHKPVNIPALFLQDTREAEPESVHRARVGCNPAQRRIGWAIPQRAAIPVAVEAIIPPRLLLVMVLATQSPQHDRLIEKAGQLLKNQGCALAFILSRGNVKPFGRHRGSIREGRFRTQP